MDNITHTMVGAVIGRVFDEKLPPRVAFWTAAISSNMPDLDIIYRFEGAAKYFAEHRGYSHSVVGIPVEALVLAGIVWLFVRQKFWWIYLVALMGGFGHMIFDLLNPYGTYALLPFSDKRYACDLVFIVDPFIWVSLITALVWGRVRVNLRRASAGAVLFVLAGYIFLRTGAHQVAARQLLANPPITAEEKIADYGVYPKPLEFWQWRYVLETERNFYRGEVSIFGAGALSSLRYAKVLENDYVDAAKKSYLAQVFLGFARFPYLSLDHIGKNTIVRWDDLRYVAPKEENFFSAQVEVSPEKQIVELEAPPMLVKRIWRRIKNRD